MKSSSSVGGHIGWKAFDRSMVTARFQELLNRSAIGKRPCFPKSDSNLRYGSINCEVAMVRPEWQAVGGTDHRLALGPPLRLGNPALSQDRQYQGVAGMIRELLV